MKKRIFAIAAALLLCVSLLTACSSGPVTAEKAQKIALEHEGLKESDVSDIHTHLIDQNGAPCFQIHMTTAEGDVTIVVDAATGEVIGHG